MRAIAFAAVLSCLLLNSAVAFGNVPEPKKFDQPPPRPADPTMPIAGLGAAAGAVALGVWFLRKGTTKPGG